MDQQPDVPGTEPSRPAPRPRATRPAVAGRVRGPKPPDLQATQDFEQPAPPATTPPPEPGENAPHQETVAELPPDRTLPGEARADAPPAPAEAPAGPEGQPSATLGDFRLLKKLGGGGMGTVYKAHQVSLDRDVAIKVLARELAAKPAFVERFRREARVMARLDHPNILRCFEVGQERGLHYYAMDYAEGGSLESWASKLGPMEVGDVLHIALACARALEYAHEHQLVHRDVKPDNVLLTRRGAVKVADLGLVKALEDDQSLTQSGVGAGTPAYMAPEQARNAKYADARSDIYALGCMLYRLLTGRLPFEGKSHAELLEAKERGRVPPARDFNPEVPPRLGLMLDKMMARRPEHRYQSCAELIKDLEGLGLANPALTFLRPEGRSPRRAASSPPPSSAPTAAAPKSRETVAPAAQAEGAADLWYVADTTGEGKRVTRKLTTEQVLTRLRRGKLAPGTPASRELGGGYRELGSYEPFAEVGRKRGVQDRAERKAETFRSLYEKIDQEEQRRQRLRWLHNLVLKVGGGVKLLIWLGILAAAGVGLYLLASYGIRWLSDKGEEFKNQQRPVEIREAPKKGR